MFGVLLSDVQWLFTSHSPNLLTSMKDVCSKESGMVALVAEEQDLVLFPENGQGEQGELPWPPQHKRLVHFGLVHLVCNWRPYSVLLGQSCRSFVWVGQLDRLAKTDLRKQTQRGNKFSQRVRW